MLGRRSEDDDVDLHENLSNQYSQINTTVISEFQGVVTFPSSGRKLLAAADDDDEEALRL